MSSSSSSGGRVPDLSRLSLVAGAYRQLAPTSIDASLLSMGAGGGEESVLRLRYHEIISRAFEREWQTVPPNINNQPWPAWFKEEGNAKYLDSNQPWAAWFKEEGNAKYLDAESRLVPTKKAPAGARGYFGNFVLRGTEIEFVEKGGRPTGTANSYLRKLKSGNWVWQVRFGVSTPRPNQPMELEEEEGEEEEEEGLVSSRLRSTGVSGKSVETPEGDALTLRQEYFTHCVWLYLIQQPSHWSSEKGTGPPNEVGTFKTFVTAVKLNELRGTDLGDELVQAHVDMYGSTFDDPASVQRSLYFLVEAWKMEKTLDNVAPQLTKPMSAIVMRRWHKWLKAYTLSVVGTVYMTRPASQDLNVSKYDDVGGAPKDAPNDDADAEEETETGELKGLSVEHITPISWTRDTRLLEEFWNPNLDPVTLASSEKGVNSQRSNSPLRFPPAPTMQGTWTPIGEWGNFSDPALENWATRPTTHAFVARALVYSTLTYPLISSDYGNAWKWTTFTERASPSPGGIIDYAKQFDRIVALATSDPAKWEVRIAARCWVRFRIVNPLTVSDQTRKALRKEGHPLRKLLRARWEGRDLCGAECLRTLQMLVQQAEASA